MKIFFTILTLSLFTINFAFSQSDTMYIHKNGAVVYKRAVTEIDSVAFYKVPDIPTVFIPSVEFNGTLYVYPEYNSTGIQWRNGDYTVTGATSLTDGAANTIAIITNQGAGSYAAQICADLNSLGFDDWYLPAKDELNALYLNKDAIGGFETGGYWSSSEIGSSDAWGQNLYGQGYYNKVIVLMVRCVRR